MKEFTADLCVNACVCVLQEEADPKAVKKHYIFARDQVSNTKDTRRSIYKQICGHVSLDPLLT